MIFYWVIKFLLKIKWFLKIPDVNQFAFVDVNAKCPICGHRDGRLRCVMFAKGETPARNISQEGQILCQHICNICGARWHDKPVRGETDPTKVLPCVWRNRREQREDRWAILQTDKPDGQTAPST